LNTSKRNHTKSPWDWYQLHETPLSPPPTWGGVMFRLSGQTL